MKLFVNSLRILEQHASVPVSNYVKLHGLYEHIFVFVLYACVTVLSGCF